MVEGAPTPGGREGREERSDGHGERNEGANLPRSVGRACRVSAGAAELPSVSDTSHST